MSEDTPAYEAPTPPPPRTIEQVGADLRAARTARDTAEAAVNAATTALARANDAARDARITVAQLESELASAT